MKGYYQQEEATQQAFLDKERQWLRSGDLGFIDPEGYVHISDRKKDLIIVKGLNVYPKEVEPERVSLVAGAVRGIVTVVVGGVVARHRARMNGRSVAAVRRRFVVGRVRCAPHPGAC